MGTRWRTVADTPSPEDATVAQVDEATVARLVSELDLPGRAGEVLLLKLGLDSDGPRSNQLVADMSGLTKGTVKSYLSLARVALRDPKVANRFREAGIDLPAK